MSLLNTLLAMTQALGVLSAHRPRSPHRHIGFTHRSFRLRALLGACVLMGFGCRSDGPPPVRLRIEAAGDLRGLPLTIGDAPGRSALTDDPTRVALFAAVNEVVSFRFAVEPSERVLERPDLRVTASDGPGGMIDPSMVTIYRMHRVPVDRTPGWHIRSLPPNKRESAPFDLLVPVRAPRGGLPATLSAGQSYWFWVDLTVPKGTAEGLYVGAIELRSRDLVVGRVRIELNVLPLSLPDEDATPLLASVDHRALFRHHLRVRGEPFAPPTDDWRSDPRRAELDGLLHSTLRTLRAHRVTPTLPDLVPMVRLDRRGAFEVDWSAYDEVIAPCLSGRLYPDRVPAPAWPMPVKLLMRGTGTDDGSLLDDDRVTADYLQKCSAHFESMGWLDRSFASISDGDQAVPIDERLARRKRTAEIAASVRPRPRVLSDLFPQDLSTYGWAGFAQPDPTSHVDIWAPRAQFFDPDAMRAERDRGRTSWLSVDRPPFSGTTELGAPPGCVLGLAWQLAWLGAEAGMLGYVNDWPAAVDGPDPAACVSHDSRALIYPGAAFGLSEPVPSVRLKLVRRTMQDAAYVRLLRDRGQAQIAKALERTLVTDAGAAAYRTHFADGRRIGFALETGAYDLARRAMVDALVTDRRGGSEVSAPDDLGGTAAWRRLMSSTRHVELVPEGCRARLASSDVDAGWEIECWVRVVNQTRVPVGGTARWANLPPGWDAESGGVPVAPIGPDGVGRVLLTATADGLPVSRGDIELSIRFDAERPRRAEPVLPEFDAANHWMEAGATGHECRARIALLTAIPQDGRIVVDGDLSDWSPGRENVADDFRLISGPPPAAAESWATHPPSPTLGFVARDEHALYVAFRCMRDVRGRLEATTANTVQYDDLIPVGEELVEILIDPLNAGTRSASDLYHLLIKPSGVYLAERGIRTDPPCCDRRPWSADVQAATRVHEDHWTVEVRIPFSAFGEGAGDHPEVWGLNLTRFDASHDVFSTWSGAIGNAYDPLSLGNVLIPAWPEGRRVP